MYWYEKENGALLRFEKDAFLKFMREYNHSDMKMMFSYDNQHRFCVDVRLPVKPAPDERWRTLYSTLCMNMIIREEMRMDFLVDRLRFIL